MVKAIDDPEVIQALIKRAAVETKRAIETAGMVNEEPAETATAESNRF
jgi:hypothetical protein